VIRGCLSSLCPLCLCGESSSLPILVLDLAAEDRLGLFRLFEADEAVAVRVDLLEQLVAEEDRRRRAEADTRNQADTLVYQTEKLLRENGDKIDAGERAKVETAVGALKDALAGSDVDAIKRGTENLMQVSQGFAQRLYEAASASAASSGGPSSPGSSGPDGSAHDDEVVDAEIVDEGTG
jgi:hypothetical protein